MAVQVSTCDCCGKTRPHYLFDWLNRNEWLLSMGYFPSEYVQGMSSLPHDIRNIVMDNRIGKYSLCRHGCGLTDEQISRQDRLDIAYQSYMNDKIAQMPR